MKNKFEQLINTPKNTKLDDILAKSFSSRQSFRDEEYNIRFKSQKVTHEWLNRSYGGI